MGEDKPKKSLRLKFKGDADPRKRRKKHHHHHSHTSEHKDESDAEQYGGDEQAWVPIHSTVDLHGPAYIYATLDGTTWALGLDALKRVALLPAASSGALGEAEAAALLAGTDAAGASVTSIDPSPESVYAVWVASRVAGSDAWNFRSAEHTFLSSAPDGTVSAHAPSRGPLENWSPESLDVHETAPGAVGIRLKTPQGTYLSISELTSGSTKPRITTTSETDPGSAAQWHVRVQWKHRHFARAEHAKATRTHLPPPAATGGGAGQAGIVLSYGSASGSGSGPRGKYYSATAAVDARARAKSDKYAK